MFSRSLTYHLLRRFFLWIASLVKESVIIAFLLSFSDCISTKVRGSRIYAWMGRDFVLDKYYKTSLFYKVLDAVWTFIIKTVRKIQILTRKIFSDSLCLGIFDFLEKKGVFSVDCIMALFIGCMFIAPHEMWNNVYAFLGAVFFAVWIVMNIASGKIKTRGIRSVGLSILVFLLFIILSTVTALVVSDAVRIALFLLASVIFAYGIYASVDTKEKLVRFLKIVLFFVSLTAVYGIIQRIMGVEVDLEFVDIAANEGMPGRVYSTFSNPNNFAQLLVLFMPFFVPLFLSVKKKTDKALVLAGFCVSLGAIAMTYSRSGWVGLALAAVVFVCVYDKRLLIPLGILVICAIPFLPETIMNRIFTIGSMEDTSNAYRIYIWESCVQMMKDFGFTGLGLGPASFKVMYPGYASPVAITAPHSHMLYMEIVLEMGIIGALSFFGYIFSVVKKTAGKMRVMDKEIKAYAIAGISALLGIAFVCCAEYIWFYPRVMFAFWMVPGILMAIVRIARK